MTRAKRLTKLPDLNLAAAATRGVPPPSQGHNSILPVEMARTEPLKLDDAGARRFSRKDVRAASWIIKRFGVRQPLVVDGDNVVRVGAITLLAARHLGLDSLPIVRAEDLGPNELQALSVAYGRLGELGDWDKQRLGTLMLSFEAEIPGFDLDDLGFETSAIDIAIAAAEGDDDPDEPMPPDGPAVSKLGDVWLLDKHRLICGDARDAVVLFLLTVGKLAAMVFADPPFGCAIDGFVAGRGRHREFVMASGEMSEAELADFFSGFIKALHEHLDRGALVYLVIDWRSLHLLLDAARPILGRLVNLAVWVKDRGGMGSFLRSRHELVLIFKKAGKARNNVELGMHGRDRTNVWEYPSAMTFGKGSDEGDMLAAHPTPKPVRLVADAILDCTRRGDIVLDTFLGSGTTLIAAEKTGRVCHAVELDPLYVDLAVRRWQAWTGGQAVHAVTGQTFGAAAAAAAATPVEG